MHFLHYKFSVFFLKIKNAQLAKVKNNITTTRQIELENKNIFSPLRHLHPKQSISQPNDIPQTIFRQ